MIVEQTRLLGIIPISKVRPIEPGKQIPLIYKLEGGQNATPITAVVSKLLEVVDAEHIKLHDVTSGAAVTYENDTPQEINEMRLHTSGCISQNVYRYVPSK